MHELARKNDAKNLYDIFDKLEKSNNESRDALVALYDISGKTVTDVIL
jgi:hypothetical protein